MMRYAAGMRYIFLVAIVWLGVFRSISVRADDGAPSVGNGALRIEFDAHRGAMRQVTDVVRQRALLIGGGAPQGLWTLVLMDGTAVGPEQAASFQWEGGAERSRELTLRWSGFGVGGAPDLAVTARVAVGQTAVAGETVIAEFGGGAATPLVRIA